MGPFRTQGFDASRHSVLSFGCASVSDVTVERGLQAVLVLM